MASDRLDTPEFIIKDINRARTTVKVFPKANYIASAIGRMAAYKAFPEKTRRGLEEAADYVRTEMIPRAFSEEGPGWKPLAERTKNERWKDGFDPEHPILVRTGDLFDELTEKSHPKHIEVIRVGRKARIEIGGSSRKFFENQMGARTKNVPPRPMIPGTGGIPITQGDRDAMKNYIIQSIKRKDARRNG